MMYLLDTHTWVFWHLAPEELSRKVRKLLSNPAEYETLLLSIISVWELCLLLEKGRVTLSCSPEEWIRDALDMPHLRLAPLTPRLAYQATVLPGAFHRDPADRIIVATAREEGATILTKDTRLREYKSVKTFW